MKFLWIRIKIFFTSKKTIHFVKVLVISFPLVFMSILGFIKLIDIIHKRMDHKDIQKSFQDIIKSPFQINNNPVLDHFPNIESEKINKDSEPEFWTGDAVHYRYIFTNRKPSKR